MTGSKEEKLSYEQLQRMVLSLQTQLSEYIGKYTEIHVQLMEAKQDKEALMKQLEEYVDAEIKEMDEDAEDMKK